ncbi:MAG: ABC transporter permease [Pyrinomonadaceae bacterium]
MNYLALSRLAAVFQTEVLLNTKRVAPYAMALLFAGNALLWWGWGPAAAHGWAVNSEFFIAGALPVYSFMTLPLFTAVMMADPVIRDFRMGVDPLVFSKPVTRAEYLLGKFCGNFFVLACCQAAFVLMLFVLQGFRKQGVIVGPVLVFPYLRHFVVFVVISHLVLAAFYFTVGTVTRNAKIVYGLAVCFYPLYIGYQVILLKSLPFRWRSALDPLLMNWRDKFPKGRSAEWFNQLAVTYDSDLIVNRVLMIAVAVICLTILCRRFSIADRSGSVEKLSMLNLSTFPARVYFDSERPPFTGNDEWDKSVSHEATKQQAIALPAIARENRGLRSSLNKLFSALEVEFQLLRAERVLVLFFPLAVFFCVLELAFYEVVPNGSYSAVYSSSTAGAILLFLVGITVFLTGELLHRDRELRIEPVLWATPAHNNVLLISKFLATSIVELSLVGIVGITAMAIQLMRGHTPVEVSAYLAVYSVILFPTMIFMTSISIALNVILRDKYVTYAVSIAIGAGLFYFYNTGFNHWIYNPALYQRWTYSEVTGGLGSGRILIHRIYCIAIASACLSLAHWTFERQSSKGLIVRGRPNGRAFAILLTTTSALVAAVTGYIVAVVQ